MNTLISYANLTATTFQNAAGEEQYNFAIALTTNLAGLIREDSVLTVDFQYGGESHLFDVQCYSGGSLITEHEFTGLAIPNVAGNNTITAVTLAFDYLDENWRTINFTYGGSMVEQIEFVHTLIP